jgi:hypothetical protein
MDVWTTWRIAGYLKFSTAISGSDTDAGRHQKRRLRTVSEYDRIALAAQARPISLAPLFSWLTSGNPDS